MKPELFRKEAMEQLTSPEKLDDYIRVSTPGIWLLLGAILIFLAGVLVWGTFGHLDVTVDGTAVVQNGELSCYIGAEDISNVKPGMKITVNKKDSKIRKISEKSEILTEENNSDILDLGTFTQSACVFEATAGKTDLPDGIYKAVITVESISPASFVFN